MHNKNVDLTTCSSLIFFFYLFRLRRTSRLMFSFSSVNSGQMKIYDGINQITTMLNRFTSHQTRFGNQMLYFTTSKTPNYSTGYRYSIDIDTVSILNSPQSILVVYHGMIRHF